MPRVSIFVLAASVLAVGLLAGCPPEPPDPRPEAFFEANVRMGNPPLTVQFTDRSHPGDSEIKSWVWEFGDGTTSGRPNPQKTYYEPGSYDVALTVTNAYGSNTRTVAEYIVIESPADFGVIGPAGGTAAAKGATLSIGAGVLDRDVVYGFLDSDYAYLDDAPEPLDIVSDVVTITHNHQESDLVSQIKNGAVVPATLTLAFTAEGLPQEAWFNRQIQILAKLEDGRAIPLLGTIGDNTVTARITTLPPRATYAVVYRPQSYEVAFEVPPLEKEPTDTVWQDSWRIGFSDLMLQQLTALRLGSTQRPSIYDRRDFTQAEIEETAGEVGGFVQGIHQQYAASGLRSPMLTCETGCYGLVFYNASPTYTSQYASFRDLFYRGRPFGHVVLDPRQLLAISKHNAVALQNDPDAVDIAQKLSFGNAFAQELFQASFEGYDFPKITAEDFSLAVTSGEDLSKVGFLQALEDGAAVFLGQLAGELEYARAFGQNEYALLSTPLLFPFHETLPDYSVSGQDFFFYVFNRGAEESKAKQISEEITLVPATLEAIRALVTAQLEAGADIGFEDALLLALQAIDASLREAADGSLADIYLEYAQDLAVENPDAALLRPSDLERRTLTANDDRFDADVLVKREMEAPTHEIEVSANEVMSLAGIPPMTSRLIQVQVNPLAYDMTLVFNADEWTEDENGNTLAVTVYKQRQQILTLAEDGEDTDFDERHDTLELTRFFQEPEDCYATLNVLVSNLSLETASSFAMMVETFAGMPVDSNEVLDTYLETCEPNYSYELIDSSTIPTVGATAYTLHMTSGAWRGPQQADQVLWEHYVSMVVPPVVTSDKCLLVISGGSTGSPPNEDMAEMLLPFSLSTGSVVALIRAVPNQPLVFADETRTRVEDAIIAYSYDEFLTGYAEGNPDMTWPALLPMTRAAVRAMDSLQDFLGVTKPGTHYAINDFVITGASKRGWTTWLSAAGDERVSAIMPIVIDVLNMDQQMQHHFSAYGFYSDAIEDYVEEDVFDRLGTPEGRALLKIVDPYEYRTRLTMPKYIANSTGDQFFLPDSAQFYFHDLPGENFLYYAPNTDHGLVTSNSLDLDQGTFNGLLAFYASHVRGLERPTFTWELLGDDTIVVESETEPLEVLLWQANNSSTRDFRLEIIGEAWSSTELRVECPCLEEGEVTPEGELAEGELAEGEDEFECPCELDVYRYIGQVEQTTGWTAFFIQLTYPGPETVTGQFDYRFSTQVYVVPDTYPLFEEE